LHTEKLPAFLLVPAASSFFSDHLPNFRNKRPGKGFILVKHIVSIPGEVPNRESTLL
jgi:hypothetical protein